ncbi:hypothetical protein RYA05_02405 [Pseudomonas syringae pv. actinidiae]|nr:hypothetical protein [Pseudomonas syringae pv. actinidiae]
MTGSTTVPAIGGYSSFEAMALAGWKVVRNCQRDPSMTDAWHERTRWSMERSKAPYEFADGMRMWMAPTFEELVQIATGYRKGPDLVESKDTDLQRRVNELESALAQIKAKCELGVSIVDEDERGQRFAEALKVIVQVVDLATSQSKATDNQEV